MHSMAHEQNGAFYDEVGAEAEKLTRMVRFHPRIHHPTIHHRMTLHYFPGLMRGNAHYLMILAHQSKTTTCSTGTNGLP